MYVLSLVNHKGGVGKTSTALTLASGLSQRGYRTLFIDLDPQGNATYTVNVSQYLATRNYLTSNRLFTEDVIRPQLANRDGFDLIGAKRNLAVIETNIDKGGYEYFKDNLNTFKYGYDICIIDTPPALSNLTINALLNSDFLIIPVLCDMYSLQGVEQLKDTIRATQEKNKKLKVLGILFNQYNRRYVLSKMIEENFEQEAKNLETTVFKTRIRRAQSVVECSTLGVNIFEQDPKSKVTKDFNSFVDEVITRIENSKRKVF